ncbi:MAG: rod shape-determining protein [Deltaproteobacteria bacterium]|nr:rod shape-determining protein [Deltaproteobacteria bacterium]
MIRFAGPGSTLVAQLGSATCAIAKGPGGAVFREASRILVDFRKVRKGRRSTAAGEGVLLAVGNQALTPPPQSSQAQLIAPIAGGAVRDSSGALLLLQGLIRRHHLESVRSRLAGRDILLLVPPGADNDERRIWQRLGETTGRGRVRLVNSLEAAARGAGLDLNRTRGVMIVDMGAESTALGVYSIGEKVALEVEPYGGSHLNRAIIDYLLRRYRISLSPAEAEKIKLELGSVYPQERPAQFRLTGSDTSSGIVKKISLDDNEIRDVLVDACEPLLLSIQRVFEQVPPELAADVSEDGVTLVGGGALLKGLRPFLKERTGMEFHPADDPANAAVRGALALLHDPEDPRQEEDK